MTNKIIAAYADGGCIGRNPSPRGGTYAVCLVDEGGERIKSRTGIILPSEHGLAVVSNNHSEYFAVGMALNMLPDGWGGPLYSDSQITLGRVFWGWATGKTGIPIPGRWVASVNRHLARLGRITPVLLDGHPTKVHLASGAGSRGNPVSEHNAWCDSMCRAAGEAWLKVQSASPSPSLAE